MLSPFHWPNWGWRLLVQRLNRLRQTLETIQENLHQAIARAVGQSFGELLQDIMHTLFAEDESTPVPSSYRSPPRSPYSRDQSPTNTDPWDERFDAEQVEDERRWLAEQSWDDDESTSAECEKRPRWLQALLVGFQVSAWWLRRATGPYPLLAALAVGSVTGTVAYGVHPATGVAVGLAGSLLSLLTLRNRLLFGTSFLNRHEDSDR